MVSTMDLAGGSALVKSGNQGNALHLVAAEMFTQWCDDVTVLQTDVSVERSSAMPEMISEADFLPVAERRGFLRLRDLVYVQFAAALAYGLDWYDMLGMVNGPRGGA